MYVGFEPLVDDVATVAYYATAGFESAGGRALADQIVQAVDRLGVLPAGTGDAACACRSCGRHG